MQNRYVGDLGDFGKYGLLRALCDAAYSGPQLSLGVVWYLVPNEDRTSDGSHIQYLSASQRGATVFQRCDPELYEALRRIVANQRRRIESIREDGVLPRGTVFFEEVLTFAGLARNKERRLAHRLQWVERAYEATARCDGVFLDPDNGLDGRVLPHHKNGPKYVFLCEARKYLERGQSLIIYHHLGRHGIAREQIERQFRRLLTFSTGRNVFAMLYHRGTARTFFVIEAPRHRSLFRRRAESLLRGPWSRHFELVDPSNVRS